MYDIVPLAACEVSEIRLALRILPSISSPKTILSIPPFMVLCAPPHCLKFIPYGFIQW